MLECLTVFRVKLEQIEKRNKQKQRKSKNANLCYFFYLHLQEILVLPEFLSLRREKGRIMSGQDSGDHWTRRNDVNSRDSNKL